jgi:hypothetical protein
MKGARYESFCVFEELGVGVVDWALASPGLSRGTHEIEGSSAYSTQLG